MSTKARPVIISAACLSCGKVHPVTRFVVGAECSCGEALRAKCAGREQDGKLADHEYVDRFGKRRHENCLLHAEPGEVLCIYCERLR